MPTNPLVYMRLAQELRKLDRLEESLECRIRRRWNSLRICQVGGWRWPGRVLMSWMVRGARDEVQHVLKMVSPGSPEEAAAQNLISVVYGATKERGRRFEYIFSPEGTAADA